MGIMDIVEREWAGLMGAPKSFVVLGAACLALGFTAGAAWKGQVAANAESYLRMKVEEIEKFKGEAEELKKQLAERPEIVGGEDQDPEPDFMFRPNDPNAPIQTGRKNSAGSDSGFSKSKGIGSLPYDGQANSLQNSKQKSFSSQSGTN